MEEGGQRVVEEKTAGVRRENGGAREGQEGRGDEQPREEGEGAEVLRELALRCIATNEAQQTMLGSKACSSRARQLRTIRKNLAPLSGATTVQQRRS